MTRVKIDTSRFKSDFDSLATIGATNDGGVHRPALGPDHLKARQWFTQRAQRDGLTVNVDSAGNHSAVLLFPEAEKALLLGSHLDSVPYGGKYDGALGVVAALEVLSAIKASGRSLGVNLEAVDFTDEEGTLVGALGSEAMAGELTPERLCNLRCSREEFVEALKRGDLKEESLFQARRNPDTLAGYLELHIEQGPWLHDNRIDIGVVTSIVGSRSFRISFNGRPDHAGTTPMTNRADAGLGACAFNLALNDIVVKQFHDCVATVGGMEFKPGAFNIIPGQASLCLEFRSRDKDSLEKLKAGVINLANDVARHRGLDVSLEEVAVWDPVHMSPDIQRIINTSASNLGLSTASIASAAGHDAQSFAPIIPTGMIFIPSIGGISHSPQEFSKWRDCVNGAKVLLNATLAAAESLRG